MTKLSKTMTTRVLIAAAALLAMSGSALAVDVKVKLTGAEETPPVTTTAFATGTIVIAADKSVNGKLKSSGMDGTVAHIHVGAPGQSGPPIITLVQGPDGTWSVPEGAKLTDDQYTSFKAGDLYVNIHSADHKPGEIRAQLKL
jgi:CHRD domain